MMAEPAGPTSAPKIAARTSRVDDRAGGEGAGSGLVLVCYAISLLLTVGVGYLVTLWAQSAVAGGSVGIVGFGPIYLGVAILLSRGDRR